MDESFSLPFKGVFCLTMLKQITLHGIVCKNSQSMHHYLQG